jgi:hypothetical protein
MSLPRVPPPQFQAQPLRQSTRKGLCTRPFGARLCGGLFIAKSSEFCQRGVQLCIVFQRL